MMDQFERELSEKFLPSFTYRNRSVSAVCECICSYWSLTDWHWNRALMFCLTGTYWAKHTFPILSLTPNKIETGSTQWKSCLKVFFLHCAVLRTPLLQAVSKSPLDNWSITSLILSSGHSSKASFSLSLLRKYDCPMSWMFWNSSTMPWMVDSGNNNLACRFR